MVAAFLSYSLLLPHEIRFLQTQVALEAESTDHPKFAGVPLEEEHICQAVGDSLTVDPGFALVEAADGPKRSVASPQRPLA